MNSGLPSWSALVTRLIDRLAKHSSLDEKSVKSLDESSADLQRKAEEAFALLRSARRGATLQSHEIVAETLYESNESCPPPGPLAQSLARLLRVRGFVDTIVTTNYDTILEAAIEKELRLAGNPAPRIISKTLEKEFAYSADELTPLSELCELPASPDETIVVLHLHGLASKKYGVVKAETPFLLSEADYLQYEDEIHSVVRDALERRDSIIVGMSMTDRNLLKPLHSSATCNSGRKHAQFSHFILSTLPLRDSRQTRISADIGKATALYLETNLKTKPILLKSRAQVNQLAKDLALWNQVAKREESAAINLDLDAASSERELLHELHRNLNDDEIRKNAQLALRDEQRAISKIIESVASYGNDELFALYFWARHCEPAPPDPETFRPAGYAIELMLNSFQFSQDRDLTRKNIRITEDSKFTAAKAMYQGVAVCDPLQPGQSSTLWSSILAVPFAIKGTRTQGHPIEADLVDEIPIGAITLNAAFKKVVSNANQDESGSNTSILQRLSPNERLTIERALADAAQTTLRHLLHVARIS